LKQQFKRGFGPNPPSPASLWGHHAPAGRARRSGLPRNRRLALRSGCV